MSSLLSTTILLSACSPGPMLRWQAPADGSSVVVHRGDTLYSIAFRNNLDYHRVAAWNGIGSDYTIYPGQRLRLTPPSRRRQAVRAPSGRAAAARASSASAPPRTGATAGGAGIPLDTPPPPGSPRFNASRWRWPVQGQVVRRFDPGHGSKGIDIAGRIGQMVVATAPGKVVYSGNALKGYGELVIIKHDARFLSAYGYNRKRLVAEGQWVRAGQPIAELGEGPQRKPELHFEIRDRGQPVDPLKLLPAR